MGGASREFLTRQHERECFLDADPDARRNKRNTQENICRSDSGSPPLSDPGMAMLFIVVLVLASAWGFGFGTAVAVWQMASEPCCADERSAPAG